MSKALALAGLKKLVGKYHVTSVEVLDLDDLLMVKYLEKNEHEITEAKSLHLDTFLTRVLGII